MHKTDKEFFMSLLYISIVSEINTTSMTYKFKIERTGENKAIPKITNMCRCNKK